MKTFYLLLALAATAVITSITTHYITLRNCPKQPVPVIYWVPPMAEETKLSEELTEGSVLFLGELGTWDKAEIEKWIKEQNKENNK